MEFPAYIVTWCVVLVSVFALPLVLAFLFHRFMKQAKARTFSLFTLFLTACVVTLFLFCTPIHVPAEFVPYVSAENKTEMRDLSGGIYTTDLPLIPLGFVVTDADEDGITYRIRYFPLGDMVQRLSHDGAHEIIAPLRQ